ncbi:putative leucine-rich repeat domain superfamily [Plasmopara halstedii]
MFTKIVEKARGASTPTRLDLRGNRFEAGAARALAALLRTSHNVVSISLEWNNVGLLDQGVEALAGALEMDKRLLTLDLRNNNITPEGAKALAKALRVNQTLRQLDLRWNDIGNIGVLAFTEALQFNHSLLTLKLTGNNCSLKHVEKLELLLNRNRGLTETPLPLTKDASCQNDCEILDSESRTDDQLLLQLLAEKEKLEIAVNLCKQEEQKALEGKEELILQLQRVRKDADMAKDERDRYQQREVDAKRDIHELKMQLDELENRRKLEFEEYRSARKALERENGVYREKARQMETLHGQEREQKDKHIAQLEEAKYTLENEKHRTSLTIRQQQDEIIKLENQLQDAEHFYARKEERLVSEHDSKLIAAQRQHDLVIGSIQIQLSCISSQFKASENTVRELQERCESLQAKLLQSQIEHEQIIGKLKQDMEMEVQERVQRMVGSVEAQVVDVKRARQHLEQEVTQNVETIRQLRQDNVLLQQAKNEKQRELDDTILAQATALSEKGTLLATAVSERARLEEKLQLQQRKMEDQDARLVQMQACFNERVQELTMSAKVVMEKNAINVNEKTDMIALLESKVLQLERDLTTQNYEHEKRIDDLAESFGRFVQEQIGKERERRKKISVATIFDG